MASQRSLCSWHPGPWSSASYPPILSLSNHAPEPLLSPCSPTSLTASEVRFKQEPTHILKYWICFTTETMFQKGTHTWTSGTQSISGFIVFQYMSCFLFTWKKGEWGVPFSSLCLFTVCLLSYSIKSCVCITPLEPRKGPWQPWGSSRSSPM